MSTPPPPTAPGLTRATIKTRIEDTIAAALNPTADPKGWRRAHYHVDDFARETDNVQPRTFVVTLGQTQFDSAQQATNRANGPKSAYVKTDFGVRMSTRMRVGVTADDLTLHQEWVGSMTRAVIGAPPNCGRVLYAETRPSQSISAAQVVSTVIGFQVRHILPLE